MAKLFKLVDPNEPGTSGAKCLTTDWNKCVLCQEDTDEMRKCPYNSARSTYRAGYKTIAEHLTAFNKLSCPARTLKLLQRGDGQGIEASFRLHKAKWHDSYRLQYNKTKLQGAEQRRKYTRRWSSDPPVPPSEQCIRTPFNTEICVFCSKSATGDSLRNVSTFELDIRERQWALT